MYLNKSTLRSMPVSYTVTRQNGAQMWTEGGGCVGVRPSPSFQKDNLEGVAPLIHPSILPDPSHTVMLIDIQPFQQLYGYRSAATLFCTVFGVSLRALPAPLCSRLNLSHHHMHAKRPTQNISIPPIYKTVHSIHIQPLEVQPLRTM